MINSWTHFLQDSNSPIYDSLIFFHDFTIILLLLIIIIISNILISIIYNQYFNRFLLDNNFTELFWTIIPIIILIILALPSLKLLYLIDESINNKLTLKAIRHQWYWTYEYTDFSHLQFDSFIINSSNLKINEFRLIETDTRCILPYSLPIRILTTSIDVIHAWTIPSLGIKLDSTPGRLNQTYFIINRPGVFFGQCSEICGINHRFIPITIESTNFPNFKNWLISLL